MKVVGIVNGNVVKLYVDSEYYQTLSQRTLSIELVEVTQDSNKEQQARVVETWIEEWRQLFPEGCNSNGDSWRGDSKECLKKMQMFVRNYDFSKAQIFEATRRIIAAQAKSSYQYLPIANYVIHKKDTGSRLEMMCNQLGRPSNESKPVVRT